MSTRFRGNNRYRPINYGGRGRVGQQYPGTESVRAVEFGASILANASAKMNRFETS